MGDIWIWILYYSSCVNKIGAFNDGPFKNIGVNREGHAHTWFSFEFIISTHGLVETKFFFAALKFKKTLGGHKYDGFVPIRLGNMCAHSSEINCLCSTKCFKMC